jgi:NarL family two-component system sensor histidine kinase YdfH
VQKHAQASIVDISMRFQSGKLMLDIVDNGVSIQESDRQTAVGNGLINMRERAAGMNGELMIEPREEGGTEVNLSVPIP